MASEPKGLLSELFSRRVPQIMGVYIGACWLTVEMGDWISGQFGLAPNLVAYLFVLMIALLPSVAVLAWNHGAPGRDRSPRFEKFFVPTNLLFALVGVVAFFGYAPPGSPGSAFAPAESAVVERTVIDESGQEQTFTVAREGYHRFVLAMFWQSGSARPGDPVDWRQYAIPWLIAVDLNRDPLLSVTTPYYVSILDDLREAGFADGIGEPRALAIRLAQKIGARQVVRGTIDETPSGLRLSARIIDANSGAVDGEVRAEGANLLAATEALSERLRPLLAPDDAASDRFTSLPLAEAATSSIEALQSLVEGLNHISFDGDFDAAREALDRARAIDPTFALAEVWLNQVHRMRGDFTEAVAAADRALALEYKLDTQMSFAMKANRYALAGDFPTAMRVLRMWTEVHPDDFTAWVTLGQNLITMGDVEGAKAALNSAEQIDPDATNIDRLQASVELLAGDYAAAADRLRSYLAAEPQDTQARIELGQVLIRADQPEDAMDAFKEAELVGSDPRPARLQQAMLHVREGRFEAADRVLQPMLANSSEPERLTETLMVRLDRLMAAGRMREMLGELESNAELIERAGSPMQFWAEWASHVSQGHLMLDEGAAAMAALDRAEIEMGEPMNRYLALQRIEVLANIGGQPEEIEAQVERMRFFESNFSYSGAVGLVRWCEALAHDAVGRPDEAVSAMRESLELLRASGIGLNLSTAESAEFTLAKLLARSGQTSEARMLLDALIDRRPSFGAARLERARLYAAIDQVESARSDLQILLEQWSEADAEFVKLESARELLDSL